MLYTELQDTIKIKTYLNNMKSSDVLASVLIKPYGSLTPQELVALQQQYDRCELDRLKQEWRFYKLSDE